ncbi:hypothetical protein [Sulfuricurvum sp.]|uniref:hypothetical protein n=1 Tax=Sulfuricurvum sp. TaxID=2025608 RepID=UPI0025DD070F|nr:hypothetical protein [Sulfuricurvum sp.]
MISIVKGREPSSLQHYRLQPNAEYDGSQFTPVKVDIRTQLLREQGYICAYCMQRIVDNQFITKVEHWHCQDNYPKEQLSYSNMLAVCSGNIQGCIHCDTKKTNYDIKYNPAESTHRIESKIKYSTNGKIESIEADFDHQLNNILGLNCSRLVKNRKEIIDAVREGLSKKTGTRTQSEINALINYWSSIDGDGYKKPYYGIALSFLRKRLSSCTT